jgi:hypothetical protein
MPETSSQTKQAPLLQEMSTKRLQRTLEWLVRKPIRRAGLQDEAERRVLDEIERRKAA